MVYIDLIFRDLTHCPTTGDGGTDFNGCTSFTLAVGLYDKRDEPVWRFHEDTSQPEYNVGMIAGALVDDTNGWLSVRDGSWGSTPIEHAFQSAPYDDYKHFAFRMSQAQFQKLLLDLKDWVANNGSDGTRSAERVVTRARRTRYTRTRVDQQDNSPAPHGASVGAARRGLAEEWQERR
jgi:hypothetical protein